MIAAAAAANPRHPLHHHHHHHTSTASNSAGAGSGPASLRLPPHSRTTMNFLPWRSRLGLGGWSLIAQPRDEIAAVSDSGSATAEPEHLVFMVNGINGSSADWSYGAKQFEQLGDSVLVHRSECNSATSTFEGVDKMGDRLAEEVEAIVRKYRSLKKISFVAHSLGGLVARYAIGKLYSPGKIAGLEPMNFVTVATPHLGSKGNKQLPFLCGLSFLERRASQAAHFIVGRSGKHLFLTDNDKGEPLLLRMVNDSGDLKFMSALQVFKRRVAYANANSDHMVGWRTSSIRRQNELPKPNCLVADEKYPHIVYVKQDHVDDMNSKDGSPAKEAQDECEEKMITGLTKVHWERVDVSFQKTRLRFFAHNNIQVKRYWLNSDGADVVDHIRDNLLLR